MKFYFHPDAKEEFDGAVEFYEQSHPGLGLEFAEEIYATIARIIPVSGCLVNTVQKLSPLLSQ
jgi:hypothetical protein